MATSATTRSFHLHARVVSKPQDGGTGSVVDQVSVSLRPDGSSTSSYGTYGGYGRSSPYGYGRGYAYASSSDAVATDELQVGASTVGVELTQKGALRVRVSNDQRDGASRYLRPGKPLEVRTPDGKLIIEARELITGKRPTLTATTIDEVAADKLDREIEAARERAGHRETVRQTFESWRSDIETAVESARESVRNLTQDGSLTPKFAVPLAKELESHVAKALADVEKFAARAQKVEGSAKLDQKAVHTFTAAIERDLVTRRESLEWYYNDMPANVPGAVRDLEDARQKLSNAQQVAARLGARAGRVDVQAKRLLAELDRAEVKLLHVFERQQGGDAYDSALNAASEAASAASVFGDGFSSPGYAVRGYAVVRPMFDEDGTLTHWAVRFVNEGDQSFLATMRLGPPGMKNGGTGLESMGMPDKGSAAEQHLFFGNWYGDQAMPGATLTLGVRGFSWHEVQLPTKEAVRISLEDFTVENANFSETYFTRHHSEEKRLEKLKTGKVRYFQDGKPWYPGSAQDLARHWA